MISNDFLISSNALILITGSNGFIGSRVVQALLDYGFSNLRCFVRPSSNLKTLNRIISDNSKKVRLIKGNLLCREDCEKAAKGVSLVFHLAAGIEKTFAGCFMDSVVTTRNLLDALLDNGLLKRFVNVSSLTVYSNTNTSTNRVLDETGEVERQPAARHEPYAYGKIKQDELLLEYNKKFGIPYVIVRPGDVYGPGKMKISGKVGIDTFGIFLHLGGPNPIPLTYIDNCAEAIALCGLRKGINGQVFNTIDDELPTSRGFLKMYKSHVRPFKSLYVPYPLFYCFCFLWEKYSGWSKGQLPPIFNRKRCVAHWKHTGYSNQKIKKMVGWHPRVPIDQALTRYFEYMRRTGDQQ